MRSIRTQFVVGSSVAVAFVLLFSTLATYWAVDHSLRSQFDEALLKELSIVACLVEIDEEGLHFDGEDLDWTDFTGEAPRAYLDIRHSDGSVLFRSNSWGSSTLSWSEWDEEPRFEDERLELGPVRFVGLIAQPRLDPDLPALAEVEEGSADSTSELQDEAPPDAATSGNVRILLGRQDVYRGPLLRRLRLSALIVLLGALLVTAVAMSFVGKRALLDLDRLAEALRELPVDGTARSVANATVPVEARPIVNRLNGLLERIAASVTRERAFSANVAHELRTPVAGLRLLLEVALHRDRSGSEYRQSLRECLGIVVQTEGTVERLLHLNRLEAGHVVLKPLAFDLGNLVRERWEIRRHQAAAKRLRARLDLDGTVTICSDASLWSLLVDNLLDNAVSHADDGGTMWVQTRATASQAALAVCNSGSRSRQEDVPQLLERFTRGDPVRGSQGTHVGLGLALVRRIAGMVGATIHIQTEVGGEFLVALTFSRDGGAAMEASQPRDRPSYSEMD